MSRPRSVVALLAVVVLLAACGSTTNPAPTPTSAVPTGTTPAGTTPSAESPSVPPGSGEPTSSPASSPASSPTDEPPPTPPAALPMPGFAAYDQVQMIGNDQYANVFTDLSCDALAGWLQAGDWRLDGDSVAAAPSEPPALGAVVPPNTRWLALSRPGDLAVAQLVSDATGSGCQGTVNRLSRQALSAAGTYTATTSALEYQAICIPDAMSATLGLFLMGDDGTRGFVTAELPLVLGEQHLTSGSFQIGRVDMALADLTDSLAKSPDGTRLREKFAGIETFELGGADGTASVTSIDPLIATVAFNNLVSSTGAMQSLTAGVRCDLPDHALTRAAIPPSPTPTPTVAPAGGSLTVMVGTGADAISETRAGSAITCSLGAIATDTWLLSYDESGGISVVLFVPPGGTGATFSFYDFSKSPPTTVDIDPARTGGNISVTVDDRGSEVGFEAHGTTSDGTAVTLSASCVAIERP